MLNRHLRTGCLVGVSCLAAAGNALAACDEPLPTLKVCRDRPSFYQAVADAGLTPLGFDTLDTYPVGLYPNGIPVQGWVSSRYTAVGVVPDGHGSVIRGGASATVELGVPLASLAIGFDVNMEAGVPSSAYPLTVGSNGYYSPMVVIDQPGWSLVGIVSTIPIQGGGQIHPPNSGGIVWVDDIEVQNGLLTSQANPYPPVPCQTGLVGYCFIAAPGPAWYDPAPATGYAFTSLGGAAFTSINDLPVGFSDTFLVTVAGNQLGRFGPGQSVQFPSGVTAFTISGITPAVDGTDPRAFPINLSLDTAGATFTMEPFASPPTVPFASLKARVEIERSHRLPATTADSFEVDGRGVLGAASNGIAPDKEAVTLSLGSFSLTIPAGSFVKKASEDDDHGKTGDDSFTYLFKGVIAGVSLRAEIRQGSTGTFRFEFEGRHADPGLGVNAVTVGLVIGDDAGQVVVTADVDQ